MREYKFQKPTNFWWSLKKDTILHVTYCAFDIELRFWNKCEISSDSAVMEQVKIHKHMQTDRSFFPEMTLVL